MSSSDRKGGSRPKGASGGTRGQGGKGKGPNRARAVAAEKLARQRAAERRRKALLGGLVAAAVLAVAVIIGIAVYTTQVKAPDQFAVPKGGDRTGIVVGRPDAKVTIDLYVDYQCPHCKEFEEKAGATLDKLVAAGTAKIAYHPIAILNNYSTTDYSARASQASGCAADAGAFAKYTKSLFDHQPPEGGAGLSDQELIRLGKQAGASSPQFERCVKDDTYKDWTAALTDTASKHGVNSTPTIMVAGKPIEAPASGPQTVEALLAAVVQAVDKASAK